MNLTFESSRIAVAPILAHTSILNETILGIMSKQATQFLPPHWHNIHTPEQAEQWMLQQIGDIYSITYKQSPQRPIVGFLFLNGLNEKAPNEVRLGYILNEKFWGLGLATELIKLVNDTLKLQTTLSVIIAGVSKDNTASVNVLIKNGYELSDTTNESAFYQFALR